MKRDKNRFDWIKNLDETEIRRLLSVDRLPYRVPEATHSKVLSMIKNPVEHKPANFFIPKPVFALAFSVVIVLITGVLLTLGLQSRVMPSGPVGCTVTYLSGSAEQIAPPSNTPTALAVGDTIVSGMTIVTGSDSRLGLTLENTAGILIKENSRVKTERLIISRQNTDVLLRLDNGEILTDVVKLGPDASFKIETISLVATARGTRFAVSSKALDQVTVLDGEIAVGMNIPREVGDTVASLKPSLADKINPVLGELSVIKPGDRLQVNRTDQESVNRKLIALLYTIKAQALAHPDYSISEASLNNIRSEAVRAFVPGTLTLQEQTGYRQDFELLARIRQADKVKKTRILVMPFENQGETQYGWISDELTQSVIQDLGLISSVDIITDQERQNTLKTEGSVLDLKDPEAVLRLGKMTGADLIFSASYTVVNDRVRVIARLIDVAGGAAGKYLKIDNTIERRRELKNMIIFALMEQAGNYTFVGRIKSLITENERRQIESK